MSTNFKTVFKLDLICKGQQIHDVDKKLEQCMLVPWKSIANIVALILF